MKKVAFYTLGCKVNQVESEAMMALFQNQGYKVVSFTEPADVYVINTCTVTHLADRKSRQMLRQAKRRNPEATVVAVGCYVQTSMEDIVESTGVDLLVGTRERHNLVKMVEKAQREQGTISLVGDIMSAREFEELPQDFPAARTRAFLKIQEGCDQFCTYCIIPYARGPLRSLSLEKVYLAAEAYAAKGYREIVLTGIHLGKYGTDLSDKPTLTDAIEGIMDISGIKRIRLSSLEPVEVTEELLHLMSGDSGLCPHLHLPLQSGSDTILAKMNRPYTTGDYWEVITEVRKMVPNVAISTDVIVGFPGEGEEEFAATYSFLKKAQFSRLHVFPYSPRRGTPAAEFKKQVPHPTKEKRVQQLLGLSKDLSLAFHQQQRGKTLEVLVEEEVDEEAGLFAGYSGNYIRVTFPGEAKLMGQIVSPLITGADAETCRGTIS